MKKQNLIWQLALNDIRSRYASSFLGIAWAFAMPLITILVFWFVFQLGLRNMPVGDTPYILWFSAAYIPWIFFTDVVVNGCGCLVEYNYLVRKIKFQVWNLPLVKLCSAVCIHLFFYLFLCLMQVLYGVPLELYMLQGLYYSLAAGVLGLGLVYLLSALTVFFKDTIQLVNALIQIGFWVTPILWNEATMTNETVRSILACNPMHYVICGYRDAFIDRRWFWERGEENLYFWLVTGVIFGLGLWTFRKLQPYFADEV